MWGPKDEDLAEALGISCATLYLWRKEHPEFLEAIYKGRLAHDSGLIVDALSKLAFGYEYYEEVYDAEKMGPDPNDPKNPNKQVKGQVIKLKKQKGPNVRAIGLIVVNRYHWETMRRIAEGAEEPPPSPPGRPALPAETGKQELVEAPEIARLGVEIMENRHQTKIYVESEVKDGQEKTESEREERTGATDRGQNPAN